METTGPPILPTKRAACQPAILCTQARMPVLAPAAADLQAHREDLLDVLRAQRLEGMNREGSAQCPLDASVVGIEDPEEALLAIRDTVAALAAAMQNAN